MRIPKYFIMFWIFVFLSLPVSGNCDDLFPPSWRGQVGTAHAEWNFDGNPPKYPELWNYIPSSAILRQPFIEEPPPLTVLSNYEGRTNVAYIWENYGTIDFFYDNFDNPDNPEKLIRVQFTSYGELDFSVVANIGNLYSGSLFNYYDDPESDWSTRAYDIIIPSNPYQEHIFINFRDGDLYLDQVVIDTYCKPVPEPSVLLLLSTGLVGILGYGWRKSKQ